MFVRIHCKRRARLEPYAVRNSWYERALANNSADEEEEKRNMLTRNLDIHKRRSVLHLPTAAALYNNPTLYGRILDSHHPPVHNGIDLTAVGSNCDC